jgi:hypothetical protein
MCSALGFANSTLRSVRDTATTDSGMARSTASSSARVRISDCSDVSTRSAMRSNASPARRISSPPRTPERALRSPARSRSAARAMASAGRVTRESSISHSTFSTNALNSAVHRPSTSESRLASAYASRLSNTARRR